MEQVKNKKYSVVDIFDMIIKDGGAMIYPYSYEFKPNNKLNRKHVLNPIEKRVIKDKLSVYLDIPGVTKNSVRNELDKILKSNLEGKFEPKNKSYPVREFIYSESRSNISLRIKEEGVVSLPENDFGLESIESFRYKTYVLVKDGEVIIDKLPLKLSNDLFDKFSEIGIINEMFYSPEYLYIVNFSKLPLVSVDSEYLNLRKYCTDYFLLQKVKASNKVLNYFSNKLFPDSTVESSSIDMELENWLSSLGISISQGFASESINRKEEPYKSVKTTIKSVSSLPSVESVIQKFKNNKPLTLREKFLEPTIRNILCKEDTLTKGDLDDMRESISRLNSEVVRELALQRLAIMSKGIWFEGVTPFESLSMNIKTESWGDIEIYVELVQ